MARIDDTREGYQQGGDDFKSVSDTAFSGSTVTSKPPKRAPGKMDSSPSKGGSKDRGPQG